MKPPAPRARRQCGAVLVVGLIMLAVLTVLVVSMINTTVLEFRIGGASQVAAQNLANAEQVLTEYIRRNQGYWSPRVTQRPAGDPLALRPLNPGELLIHEGNYTAPQATETQCADAAEPGLITQYGTGLFRVYFSVTTRVTSTLGGETTLSQGLSALTLGC